MSHPPATQPQLDYLEALRHKLNLPKTLLDSHCVKRFGGPLSACNRAQVSHLIDELKGWVEVPAHMQREMGQQDMFDAGLGA